MNTNGVNIVADMKVHLLSLCCAMLKSLMMSTSFILSSAQHFHKMNSFCSCEYFKCMVCFWHSTQIAVNVGTSQI